jgi:release factor glutamine methyltransferase
MTFEDLFSLICPKLYDEREARNIVEWLGQDIFGISAVWGANIQLSGKQRQDLEEIARRLLLAEPVQYIIGKANFYGYDFRVDKNTLIPRPETEELVYNIVQKVKKMSVAPQNWLEVGTGSGCIAIMLKKLLPQIRVTAIDISEDTLNTARQNAQDLGVDIDFRLVDFLDEASWAQHFSAPFDALVSNPPYILPQEEGRMSQNTMHEPPAALFVGNGDVQQFYRAFARFAPHLRPSAWLWAELNEFFADDTAAIFRENTAWQNVEIIEDIRKTKRIIAAMRK